MPLLGTISSHFDLVWAWGQHELEQTAPEVSVCSATVPTAALTLGSSPSLLPGIFLQWKSGVCAALLTPGPQRKERISLRNNYFRTLWCNKAWIKPDGCLVQVGGEEQSVLCVGRGGDGRHRDLNMKISTFSTNLLDVVGLEICFPMQEDAGAGMWLFHVKSTRLPEILCAVAMKETRGFTGFYWF